jgi:hypothetical protein
VPGRWRRGVQHRRRNCHDVRHLQRAIRHGTSGTDVRAHLSIPDDGSFDDEVNLNGGDRLIAKRIRPTSLEEREKVMFEHDEFFGCCSYGVGFPGDD